MNNDQTPENTPASTPSTQDTASNPFVTTTELTGGVFPDSEPATQAPAGTAAPAWQSRQEYAQSRQPSIVVNPEPSGGKFMRICAYVLGISVFILVLASATPLGELFAIAEQDMRSGGDLLARPLVAISIVTAIISYICLMSGLISQRAQAGKSKAGVITLFVISLVALFNPISAMILLFTVLCNLSPCQSS